MQKNTLHSFGILIGALGAAAYSCSPSVDPGPGLSLGSGAAAGASAKGGSGGSTSTGAGGTQNGSGASSSGGSTSSGGSQSSSGGSIHVDIDAQSDAPTMVDEDAACGTGTASGTLKDVNMFVMYDRSWSMYECADGTNLNTACPSGPTRWDVTSEALKEFFQAPEAAGLRVALRFFPDDHPAVGCDGYTTFGGGMMMGGRGFGGAPGVAGAGSTGTAGAGPNCDTNACAQPLVDIAPLTADPAPTDVQEAALVAAIAASTPPGPAMPNPNPSTPTSAALGGAVQWATAYQAANPSAQTVIVLITDGEPQGCDTNAANIARLAANGLTAGVPTYVIGLGGLNSMVLNQIATAGGTKMAYTVSSGATSTQQLLDTLLAIRGMAISCTIDIPKATTNGQQIDPTQINVAYQNGTDQSTTDYGLVQGGKDACGTSLGWYYDNPAAPTQVLLCPAACDQVTADKMATLQILAGCKPHVITK